MKECRKLEKWLTLYAMDELAGEEKRRVELHLRECPVCAADLKEQKILLGRVASRPRGEPTSDLLEECRRTFRERLRIERRAQFAPSWRERVSRILFPTLRPAPTLALATLLLLVGLLVGRYVVPSPDAALREALLYSQSAQRLPFEEGTSPEVHSVRLDPLTGEIELRLSSANTYSIRGGMEDESIRRMLSHTLVEDVNPGIRLRTVKAIAAQPYADDKLEAAVIHAMENDPNNGVRLQAIKVLKQLPLTKPIKDAFVRVLLADTNASMRKEAIDALSKSVNQKEDEDVLQTLASVAKRDTSTYVRLKASKALERRE